MKLLGTEISSRDIILGVGVIGLILISLWFHAQSTGMGFTLSSTPCNLCH